MAVISDSETGNSRAWGLVGVFTLSIFLSAFLLFSVQPMFTKLVLPLLGGSSNVWNTAMVFFQAMLLGGYIYAHVISKYLRLSWQVVCHGLVLSAGFFFLPLAIASGWTPPAGGAQAYWLIALFSVSVGVPFFAISANAPLLQRWFSRTNDKDANDPYFLYAASNAGSLLSLCLYPVLFEPIFKLQTQTHMWAWGYGALLAVIICSGVWAVRNIAPAAEESGPEQTEKLTLRTRAFWVFLAFIPSSLMLGVTSHMANNIASVPFLWIIPLALYLLTFIIVFARNPVVTTAKLKPLFPAVIVVALIAGFVLKMLVLLSIALSLTCYFIITLMCHSRLAEGRPGTSRLTEFYIWMSVGGVCGGIFNALIAPLTFTNVYEYLIVLIAAIFAVPSDKANRINFSKTRDFALRYVAPAVALYAVLHLVGAPFFVKTFPAAAILVFGISRLRGQGRLVIIDLAVLAGLIWFLPTVYERPVMTDRSFFSILHVKTVEGDHGTVHKFIHGDTLHNYQMRDPKLRKIPLAYYGMGNTFETALSAKRAVTPSLNVAMIGLGAGAMACYEVPGDNWTYYEIDQAVVDMARNPDYFSFIADCAPNANIITGDARLTIEALPLASQDFIVIDAFSSDSIPAHLVTQEAVRLYQSRLSPDGVMFFHTSNRVMDIASVVVATSESLGLSSRYISLSGFEGQKYGEYYTDSQGVLVGAEADIVHITADNPDWQNLAPSPSVKAWTDDYSSVIGPLKSHLLKEASIRH